LPNDSCRPVATMQTFLIADVLPPEEKAHEVCLRNWLDFSPKLSQGVSVNPGEKTAFAPLLGLHGRREAAAQAYALGLESRERYCDVGLRKSQKFTEPRRRRWSQTFHPSSEGHHQCVLTFGKLGLRRDRGELFVQLEIRQSLAGELDSFGGDQRPHLLVGCIHGGDEAGAVGRNEFIAPVAVPFGK